MTSIQSLEDLDRFRQEIQAEKDHRVKNGMIQIIVSLGSCGIAAGAQETYEAVQEQVQHATLENVRISKTGCIGLCRDEPIIEVITSDGSKTTYGHVTPGAVEQIFREHILGGKVVRDRQISN